MKLLSNNDDEEEGNDDDEEDDNDDDEEDDNADEEDKFSKIYLIIFCTHDNNVLFHQSELRILTIYIFPIFF